MSEHPTDQPFPDNPRTDLTIRATQGEIRVTGLENDLDLLIPALCGVFQVERISRRYPTRENKARASVYLAITGIRGEHGI